MTEWKYYLATADDMSIIAELRNAKQRRLRIDNNLAGSASCTIRMSEKYARLASPWETCLLTVRDDEPRWSGPLQDVSGDYDTGIVTLSAVGWMETLMPILVQDEVKYTNVDAGQIAANLLALAAAQYVQRVSIGDVTETQLRTRTYAMDVSIGAEIVNLSQLESGYDWYVDPLSRELNIVARRGQDRPDAKWYFIADRPEASNITRLNERFDGSTVTNDVKARGKFSTARATSSESMARFGLRQEAAQLSDVVDNNVLNAYANAEIVYRAFPRAIYTITPGTTRPEMGKPEPFVDFDIGDTTYLTARRDEFIVDEQAIRIFGMDLSIGDDGSETVNTLKTYADQ